MTKLLQLAVAILCFALVSAVELDLISKKHDEAQALGVQLEKTSQIDLNKEAMTFAKKCEADCQAIKAKLDKLLPDLIFDVQEELHNAKPESSEGQLFHSNVTAWLQGIVTKLPVENITAAKIASDGVRKILLISGNRMDTTDSFLSADFLKFIAFACLIELFWPTISEMATGAINLFCMGLFGFIKQRI
ncbi:unnamed protein product, partial [Mesorhabditis spiculigera]